MKSKRKSDCDPVRLAAFRILCEFDRSPSPLPELIETYIGDQRFSSLDRSFIPHLVYGVVRFKEQIDYMLRRHVTERDFEKRRQKAAMLRLGAFQLMPDSKVPASAAINETIRLTRAVLGEGLTGFVNAVLRKVAAESLRWEQLLPDGNSIEDLSVRGSQPDWLVSLLVDNHGIDTAMRFLSAFQDRLETSVRVNRLRTTGHRLESSLHQLNIPIMRSRLSEEYYVLPASVDLQRFEPLARGECFVQNVASGIVVEFLSPRASDHILDMCAAPGGKTASAAMMTGRPENITAIDVDGRRMGMMRKSLTRLGLDAVSTDIQSGIDYEGNRFDVILVDAPCSGFGTIAKHPEIKYTQSRANIDRLSRIQAALLDNAARLLKQGGVVVYSVCTLTHRETDEIKEKFLRDKQNFVLDAPTDFQYHQFVKSDGALLIPPGADNLEGIFAFRARKVR